MGQYIKMNGGKKFVDASQISFGWRDMTELKVWNGGMMIS